MKQLHELLGKVHTAVGTIMGLLAAPGAGLNLNVAAGLVRVGPTTASVAALADKAAPGMNAPGLELDFAGGAIALPANTTSLVWLRADGVTLAVTPDLAPGQSYADVAPDLSPDPNKGAMINGFLVSQKGPLRQPEVSSVLIARVTTAAAAITSFYGVPGMGNTVQTYVLHGV